MEDESQAEAPGGLPGWVMTFADLMSLLMCFFVLLLSFSEMDVQKFKQLAGSMKNAFGVQKSVNVKDIPTGTSIIAREFSPGKPVPTSINEMRQQTTDDIKRTLDFSDSDQKGKQDLEVDAKEKKDEGEKEGIGDEGTSNYQGVDEEGDSFHEGFDDEGTNKITNLDQDKVEEAKELLEEKFKEQIEKEADEIREQLKEELSEGLIEVEVVDDEVLIRIKEKSSFPSGNADIRKSFYPIMNKIGEMLNTAINGRVVVAGHTDNVPIFTSQYPSNWVLSAARAANVVHYLSKYSKVPHDRMEIRAHAETKPLISNDSYENRAKNRRIEIIVKYDREDLVDVGFMAASKIMGEVSSNDINLDSLSPESGEENLAEDSEQDDTQVDVPAGVQRENGTNNADTPKTDQASKTDAIHSQVPKAKPDTAKKMNAEDEIKALEAMLKKINNANATKEKNSE